MTVSGCAVLQAEFPRLESDGVPREPVHPVQIPQCQQARPGPCSSTREQPAQGRPVPPRINKILLAPDDPMMYCLLLCAEFGSQIAGLAAFADLNLKAEYKFNSSSSVVLTGSLTCIAQIPPGTPLSLVSS